ncbi:hypothetical protein HF086_002032 [Spodoptera exigua]|uniref:Uncharacterized protein n=1 Tax=Spodoptera exigua TaxID=7107 RepID=A0A922SHQ6_SPOEX|nr:hypothetical protein HF086_002032 [Spodoptera exigua]
MEISNNTRKSTCCPIFGAPEDINENQLPTYKQVMKYYNLVRHQLKLENNSKKEPSINEISEIVSSKVECLWRKASIPTVSHNRVMQLIKSYHAKCKNLLKSLKRLSEGKIQDFHRNSEKLFDLSSCKCKDLELCKCSKDQKIPKEERAFLIDQRTERKMIMGTVDLLTSKRKRKLSDRKIKLKTYYDSSVCEPGPSHENPNTLITSESSDEKQSVPSSPLKPVSKKRTITSLKNLSTICDRYGISDRAAAAVASAVLQDAKIINEVIDKSKLRRARQKLRKETVSQGHLDTIPALFFDGRKDKTLKIVMKGGKKYRLTSVEEHISIIKEPGSDYVGYAVPSHGTAKGLESAIFQTVTGQLNMSLEDTLAIGCDGTVTNTGKYGGVIRLLEKRLQRPLQWIICLLHLNELPLRHLFAKLDGTTTGPNTYSGAIGKLLDDCEKRPVIVFERIEGMLPDISNVKDLSSDQRYLYDITSAVISGKCSPDLSNRSPGKMSHARWLTKANRILRLYVATEIPTNELKQLAVFVVKVYSPIWFEIKLNPTCKDGARHFWKLVYYSRYLPQELQSVVDPVLRRNAFFAHPENLLLSMLSDEQKHVRELAARRILKARKPSEPRQLRVFEVPKINLNASTYIDLIDWQQSYSQPPILTNVPDETLHSLVESGGGDEVLFLRLPCHTQAVERAVKTVTEASMQLCHKKAREALIKNKIRSRKLMPKFESKKDFIVI